LQDDVDFRKPRSSFRYVYQDRADEPIEYAVGDRVGVFELVPAGNGVTVCHI
jgi:hypothetical protein